MLRKKIMPIIFSAMLMLSVALVGCTQTENAVDKAGENVKDATEKAGEDIENTTEDIKDSAENESK